MHKMTQEEFNALERNESGYLVIPNNTDCTAIEFNTADRVIFGNCCKLDNYSMLGDECEFGNWCKLGYGCELGDYCVLNSNCVLGDDCELGKGCILGDRCKLGDTCTLHDRCRLGDWCEVGFGCELGKQCKLGNNCVLGGWCQLSEHISVRATFEEGRVVDGLYIQIGNIGREHRTAYFYIDKNGAMFVRAGCWFSGMDEFKTRVKSVHGGTIYETQYMAACAYAETVLPLMLKKSDAERRDHYEN